MLQCYVATCVVWTWSFWIQLDTQSYWYATDNHVPWPRCNDGYSHINWLHFLNYYLRSNKRDGYRDQFVSMSVWILATEYGMWDYFLHPTTCMQAPFIVHEGIKWHMNTSICSQCTTLFPCFFYNPYIDSKNFSFTCLHTCTFFSRVKLCCWLVACAV